MEQRLRQFNTIEHLYPKTFELSSGGLETFMMEAVGRGF